MSNFFDKFILGVWNVGIIENDVHDLIGNDVSYSIRWMNHDYHDRFFADTFLYYYDSNFYYILVEELPFYEPAGYISMLKIRRSDMRLLEKKTIIRDRLHFSYPYLYGDWIVPENFRSGKTVAYRFDGNVITETKIIMNHGLIDQTFLTYCGKEWIFATDKDNPLCGLKIYYRNLNDEKWQEHRKNPVNTDIKTARPGGHFFKIEDTLYRPVQDSEKCYGNKIRIMRVDYLDEDDYRETEIAVFSSENQGKYSMGFHTFNAENGFIVCDGYREYHSLIMKPLCLKAPKIMHLLGENHEHKKA